MVHDPVRLTALQATGLLEAPAAAAFDRLTRLAARLLRAPVAFVSLVDANRDVVLSQVGLPEPYASARAFTFAPTLCQATIAGVTPLIINDIRTHPTFSAYPAFERLGVTAYAGIPLVTDAGQALGTCCVVDFVPHVWSAEDIETLTELAASVLTEIALREKVQEAARAVQARDTLLATIVHDLRTPLSTIRGYAQVLARMTMRGELADADRFGDVSQRIELVTGRMAAMLDELLDQAQRERQQPLVLLPQATDLVPLLVGVVDAQRLGAHGCTIAIETAVSQLVGVWDRARLERVLENLLSNALKYSASGAVVTVSLAQEHLPASAWAVVRVADQGVGIPAADLPRIFERFHRGANVINRIAGVGIGLAGAKEIVEQHGGTLEVQSTEGTGTTLTMRLPLTD